VAQIKDEYQSLAKKALHGKEFMQKYNMGVEKFMEKDERFNK